MNDTWENRRRSPGLITRFNAWWGCTKIAGPDGEGSACDNCYAAALAHRYGFEVWGKNAPRRELSDSYWRKPLKWDRDAEESGRPALVFCSSMADVFEARDDLDRTRERLWDLIERTPHLIWQLLTKRPEQVLRRVPFSWDDSWPRNVWIGATVESQHFAEIRIPRLLRIQAPVRFLSCEPLLERIEIRRWMSGIDWVIVGGESGSGFRTMDLDAARDLRDACAANVIPFFFKQVSAFASGTPGPDDLMVREFPEVAARV